jgi:putative phosphoesterase
MRIVVIGDVHANVQALNALADLLDDADRIVCLGDIVGYYCQVNEAIATLRDRHVLCVAGNHDRFVVRPDGTPSNVSVRFGVEFADSVITDDNRNWLADLPLTWGGDIGGLSWFLCHGSPWRPLTDYVYPDSALLPRLKEFEYDIVAFGQTHIPTYRGEDRPVLLNPGSVGQSRHRPGLACAAVVDTDSLAVELVEQAYDVAPVLALAKKHGAGKWITKHLVSED